VTRHTPTWRPSCWPRPGRARCRRPRPRRGRTPSRPWPRPWAIAGRARRQWRVAGLAAAASVLIGLGLFGGPPAVGARRARAGGGDHRGGAGRPAGPRRRGGGARPRRPGDHGRSVAAGRGDGVSLRPGHRHHPRRRGVRASCASSTLARPAAGAPARAVRAHGPSCTRASASWSPPPTPRSRCAAPPSGWRAGAPDTICDEPSPTRLEVFEGVVAVRRNGAVTLVGRGRRLADRLSPPARVPRRRRRPLPRPAWRRRPRPGYTVVAAPAAAARRPARPIPPPWPIRTISSGGPWPPAAAATARGALEGFFELERRFPASPWGGLDGRAHALLASHDREAGRAIAREYLARYPSGFAAAEAGPWWRKRPGDEACAGPALRARRARGLQTAASPSTSRHASGRGRRPPSPRSTSTRGARCAAASVASPLLGDVLLVRPPAVVPLHRQRLHAGSQCGLPLSQRLALRRPVPGRLQARVRAREHLPDGMGETPSPRRELDADRDRGR
jgi:hypothetical protein